MQDLIRYLNAHIRTAKTFPALLAGVYVGLDLMQRTTRQLTDEAPEGTYPSCAAAEAEAIAAVQALAAAPALSPPVKVSAEAHTDLSITTRTLAMAMARALVVAADRTVDPGDRIACLDAAMHAEQIYAALS